MSTMEVHSFSICNLVSLKTSFDQTDEFKQASKPFLYTCELNGFLLVKKERYIDFWKLVSKFDKKIQVSHSFQLLPEFLIPNKDMALDPGNLRDYWPSLLDMRLKFKDTSEGHVHLEKIHHGFVTYDFLPNLHEKIKRIQGTVFLPDERVYGDEYAWYIPKSKLPSLFLILEQMFYEASY